MTRDKALIMLGFLGVAGALGLVMAIVHLIDAINHPDRWSGFTTMLLTVF
jgi:hypothetical protein